MFCATVCCSKHQNSLQLTSTFTYLFIFNCNWVDTRWQQYSRHLHTNSTQNIENGIHITLKKIGNCGPCPVFASYTPAFALQLRKMHGKPSGRLVEKCPDIPVAETQLYSMFYTYLFVVVPSHRVETCWRYYILHIYVHIHIVHLVGYYKTVWTA
jgi:hypothetical protein